jgi:hypothetical protein
VGSNSQEFYKSKNRPFGRFLILKKYPYEQSVDKDREIRQNSVYENSYGADPFISTPFVVEANSSCSAISAINRDNDTSSDPEDSEAQNSRIGKDTNCHTT